MSINTKLQTNILMNKHLYRIVNQTIKSFQMIRAGDTILAGVSGGPDSVALLYVLNRLKEDFPFKLGIAHLNHCLRGKDSDNDAQFVLDLSKNLGLPCYISKENVLAHKKQYRLSLEEAARKVRYDFFYNTAKKNSFNKIALAHHQEDNAELILMHLFRGSGPLGASGIPPIRNHGTADIKIIRPLIELSKTHIIEFLKSNKIHYVTDRSNQDSSHLRNSIRNNLLPLLKNSYNQKITETLNRLASIIRSEEEWIADIIRPIFKQVVTSKKDSGVTLSLVEFDPLPVAVKRRIIRKTIAELKGNIRRIALTHIDSIIAFSKNGSPQSTIDLPDRVRVLKGHNDLTIFQENKSLRDIRYEEAKMACDTYEYHINSLPQDVGSYGAANPDNYAQNKTSTSIFLKEINAHLKLTKIRIHEVPDIKQAGRQSAFLDFDKLDFPLILRNVMPGDRFTPLGMAGLQKVKKYFINNKIPKTMRMKAPILLSNGKVIWLVGHRIDDAYKVISTTRNVLKAELLLA